MIQIDHQTEQDLKWVSDREHLGALGYKSSFMGIYNRLQLGRQEPLITGVNNAEINDQALKAARRFHGINERLKPLSRFNRAIIHAAFETKSTSGDISAYGNYPHTVHLLPITQQMYREDTAAVNNTYIHGWLCSISYQARDAGSKQAQRAKAQAIVDTLRSASEHAIAMAIESYGGQARITEPPREMGLVDLARWLGSDPRTVKRDLASRGIGIKGGNGHGGYKIKTSQLAVAWPEAATKLRDYQKC